MRRGQRARPLPPPAPRLGPPLRRVRPCASAARTSRHSPPSASSRSRSSRPSPPARFSNTSPDTICRSLQPWLPLTATWRATDCSSPAARHGSKYKGSPARPVSPASPASLSYWNGKSPCVTLTYLVGDGVDLQISAYLPDQSGPTRHFTSFDAKSRGNFVSAKRRLGAAHEIGRTRPRIDARKAALSL